MNKRLATLIAVLVLVSSGIGSGESRYQRLIPCQVGPRVCPPAPRHCGVPGQQPCPRPRPGR